MASTIIQCTKTSKFTPANVFLKATPGPVRPAFLRVSRMHQMNGKRVVFAAFSAAGSSGANSEFNPYEVLGVNPLEGFDMVKSVYAKKRKDAERRGDEAAAAQLERAYDKIMMSQLTKRKKGETFGSFRGYTGVLNVIEFAGGYIPVFLFNNQELLVTASTALMLHVLASYYR
ncbi:hypothetical protein Sango_2668300 [Sesamum angolense]|uniref:Uncharacterized protein n=1 Tax=Sesamum angolense TaxID=2727404 RepID=A0AAE2BHA2_9LAMI|nr:hypothetical protein Sango_2668300 [Sesamum angolense]